MAQGVDFPGTNKFYGAPPGKEDAVVGIPVFTNGVCVITCWEFTDEELAEILRTRRVYMSMMSGPHLFPHYIGLENQVRELNADYGIWKKE